MFYCVLFIMMHTTLYCMLDCAKLVMNIAFDLILVYTYTMCLYVMCMYRRGVHQARVGGGGAAGGAG